MYGAVESGGGRGRHDEYTNDKPNVTVLKTAVSTSTSRNRRHGLATGTCLNLHRDKTLFA